MRLIDADELKEQMLDTPEHERDIVDLILEALVAMIDEQPTIEERKKGKWIHDGYDFPHGNDWIHCSECGKRGINVPADLTNYCPNCGADMRGKQDE